MDGCSGSDVILTFESGGCGWVCACAVGCGGTGVTVVFVLLPDVGVGTVTGDCVGVVFGICIGGVSGFSVGVPLGFEVGIVLGLAVGFDAGSSLETGLVGVGLGLPVGVVVGADGVAVGARLGSGVLVGSSDSPMYFTVIRFRLAYSSAREFFFVQTTKLSEQPKKAASPILATLSGIVISVSLLQP